MKKLVTILLIILIITIITNCSSPPASNNASKSETVKQKETAAEVKKDELEETTKDILKKMTLEEKLGQLLIVGFPAGTKPEILQAYIDKYKVSGFILFKRNYKDFGSKYELIKSLKVRNSRKNPLPLFISIDEEGGTVTRLPKGSTIFPDAQLVGKAGDTRLTYKTGEVIGEELSALGVNLNYAPVLDIVSSKDNKLLVKRSYGDTAEAVSKHGVSFIDGMQSKGVIASPKHFPGHGGTNIDSHGKLPVINVDRQTLLTRELAPYKAAMASGLDALMVGHLSFPKLDPSGAPATMSRYFLTNLLRDEMNFKGIAISDELEMYGYLNGKNTLEEAVVASFNAGLDVFVVGHTLQIQDRVLKALKEACSKGVISEERLNQSVMRIIRVKLKYKLSDRMNYSLEEAAKVMGSKEHKAVLEELKSAINNKGR